MAKIKIAFLIASMRTGGKEKISRMVFEGLDRQRFDPFLCAMNAGELLEGLPPERVYAPLAAFRGDVLGYAARLGGILWRERPQIVYCLSYRLIGAVGRTLAKLGGMKTVYELHGVERVGERDLDWLDRHLFDSLTDHYIAIADDVRQGYLRDGVAPERISFIPNGIDTQLFRPLPPDSRPKETPFGLPAHTPLIACVTNMRPKKNLGLLIEAFHAVLAQQPQAHLAIIGDGSERPALEAKIASLGLQKQVSLLGARSDIAQLVPHFDVAALSSTSEAAPLALLEAQACGVPVVATAVGDVPRLVVEGKTGFLVPSGEVAVMADRLSRLLSDADLRARMGAAARQHVLAHHSFEQSLAARQALFEALAGQKKRV